MDFDQDEKEPLLKTLAPIGAGLLFFIVIQGFFYLIRSFNHIHPLIVLAIALALFGSFAGILFFFIKKKD